MFQNILLFLTGLFFLIFSILKLSKEMQHIFGVRIRQYIKKLVKRPIQGVILGGVITAIFQSSSATTVLIVGLVSAGLISFFNSLGVILGASIGTTITAQLVSFKVTEIAPIFIIIGIVTWLISRGERNKLIGEAIFYFGLLFFGLNLMGQAMVPLRESQTFITLISQAGNPFLGLLLGFIFTAIIQSSSATASILVLLAQQGLITIEIGLPIILGANIGTTITALLASIGSGINARRTAFSHLFFRLLAVILIFPFLTYFTSFLQFSASNVGQQIANGYLFFSLLLTVFFFFWLKPFASLVRKIIPGQEKVLPLWTEYLDQRILNDPTKALQGVQKELHRGALLTKEMFLKAKELLEEFHSSGARNISHLESVVDSLQNEVMKFLDKLPKQKMTQTDVIKLVQYSSMVDNIERLADHIVNLAKLAEHKNQAKVQFSHQGQEG